MERIRDWVGHSDIRTTINLYGHLEYQSKIETAEVMQECLPLKLAGTANLYDQQPHDGGGLGI